MSYHTGQTTLRQGYRTGLPQDHFSVTEGGNEMDLRNICHTQENILREAHAVT
jgi:hypothetical protein